MPGVPRGFAGSAGVKFGFSVRGVNKITAKLDRYLLLKQGSLYTAIVKSVIIIQAEALTLIASGYYKPAIDTGRMRNSVHYEIVALSSDYMEAKVGTSVYYAIFVHEGTSHSQAEIAMRSMMDTYTGSVKMKARPFLKDALQNKKEVVKRNIENALKTEYGI